MLPCALHTPLPHTQGQRCTPGPAGRTLLSSSQGLGAPAGALLGGPKHFIEEAWRLRKALGGGMHQAGVLAAAALVGLAGAEQALQRDHQNAQRFAKGASPTAPRPHPLSVLGVSVAGPVSPGSTHPSNSKAGRRAAEPPGVGPRRSGCSTGPHSAVTQTGACTAGSVILILCKIWRSGASNLGLYIHY